MSPRCQLSVTWLFVPALISVMPIRDIRKFVPLRRKKKIVRRHRAYASYIKWGVRHRWVYVTAAIAAFGIQLCLIPAKPSYENAVPANKFEALCWKVSGWKPYSDNRAAIDKIAGSSFALFHKAMDRMNFYREPNRTVLTIRAGMLEGATVHQLNEVVRSMENYLAGFDGIDVFTTRVNSYNDAVIQVMFKPEYENTLFPLTLKSQVTSMAMNFGGANWSVSGIDESYFNNNVVSYFKNSGILLHGYNYDELLKYAETLVGQLSGNRRISGLEIWSSGRYGRPATEYSLSYDFEAMDGSPAEVVLRSSDVESLDLWHILNGPAEIDSMSVNLASVGDIVKSRSGLEIRKVNQSYEVRVVYDFIGSWKLQKKTEEDIVRWMNSEVLSVGFKAEETEYRWADRNKGSYIWLILLIMAVIYIITSVTFESFRLPLPVMFMIPVSFIGMFLVFGLSDITFDQGGFAAFVMLSGIVVNAGIYLVASWQEVCASRSGVLSGINAVTEASDPAFVRTSAHCPAGTARPGLDSEVKSYIKAYNRKINPIVLTIISTVLGLLPFLSDGPKEVFWFDFAIGPLPLDHSFLVSDIPLF